ncbi:MAG: 1,4-dihydroxy-2-naphthoate polyprenyltransferase [Actinomycetota bacterium]
MRQSLGLWIAGARPKNLPAAIAPVLVGGTCVVVDESSQRNWSNLAGALLVSLALQIAVNFANDYSDGIRGTDKNRVGPLRLVGSGSKSPVAVKRAAIAAFAVAAIVGLLLAVSTTLWLLVVGVLCLASGWFYTGGKHPYGYLGLGEIFVFVFFGVVATVGSTFVVTQRISGLSFLASVVVGCLACALLAVNNLRDIDGDNAVGKRTLAVRLGDSGARVFYVGLYLAALITTLGMAVNRPTILLGLVGLATGARPVLTVRRGATGNELVKVLVMTGRTQILTAITLSLGILLAG